MSIARALISIVGLAFVLWVLPVRDVCRDPARPDLGSAPLSRAESGCVIHGARGDRRLDAAQCAALRCQPGLVTTLSQARVGVVLGLSLLPFLSAIVWSARWRTLLGIAGRPPPLRRVWRITVESQAAGVLLPGSLGGDALRIAWAAADGTPLAVVVGSVLLDRAIGLTMLALTAGALGLSLGAVSAGPLAWALAGIPVSFAGGLLLLRSRLLAPEAPLVRAVLRGRVGAALLPLVTYVQTPGAPRAIGRALALGAVSGVYQLGLIRGIIYALHAVPTREVSVYVGTAMSFVVFAIPALPGAWGTGDAAFVFFLAPAGLDATVAFGTSMVFRLFWYVQAAFGALVGLLPAARPARRAASVHDAPSREPGPHDERALPRSHP